MGPGACLLLHSEYLPCAGNIELSKTGHWHQAVHPGEEMGQPNAVGEKLRHPGRHRQLLSWESQDGLRDASVKV